MSALTGPLAFSVFGAYFLTVRQNSKLLGDTALERCISFLPLALRWQKFRPLGHESASPKLCDPVLFSKAGLVVAASSRQKLYVCTVPAHLMAEARVLVQLRTTARILGKIQICTTGVLQKQGVSSCRLHHLLQIAKWFHFFIFQQYTLCQHQV